MSPLLKKTVKNIVFLSIGALCLWFTMRGMDMQKIWGHIKSAKISWLLFACAAGVLSHVIRALRWQQTLAPLGYKVGLKNSFIGVMIGYVVNFVIPRGGEFSRCVMINRTDKVPVQTALGTIISERILDVIMLLLCISLAVFLQFDIFSTLVKEGPVAEKVNSIIKSGPILMIAGGMFLLMTGLFLYYRKRIKRSRPYLKFKKIIDGFTDGIRSVLLIKNKPLFILYTFLMWACYFLLPYLAFKSFAPTESLSVATGITITALGAVSVAAPVQGGIGVFHYMVSSALLLFGLTQDEGMSYAFIAHGVQMILIFAVGAVCFAMVIIDENKRKSKNK